MPHDSKEIIQLEFTRRQIRDYLKQRDWTMVSGNLDFVFELIPTPFVFKNNAGEERDGVELFSEYITNKLIS